MPEWQRLIPGPSKVRRIAWPNGSLHLRGFLGLQGIAGNLLDGKNIHPSKPSWDPNPNFNQVQRPVTTCVARARLLATAEGSGASVMDVGPMSLPQPSLELQPQSCRAQVVPTLLPCDSPSLSLSVSVCLSVCLSLFSVSLMAGHLQLQAHIASWLYRTRGFCHFDVLAHRLEGDGAGVGVFGFTVPGIGASWGCDFGFFFPASSSKPRDVQALRPTPRMHARAKLSTSFPRLVPVAICLEKNPQYDDTVESIQAC